jgi:hypothetical protein
MFYEKEVAVYGLIKFLPKWNLRFLYHFKFVSTFLAQKIYKDRRKDRMSVILFEYNELEWKLVLDYFKHINELEWKLASK